MSHVVVTGGAGYIGSLLTATLLARGDTVTVVDDLLFGDESLLAFWHHPGFRFIKGDVCEPAVMPAALKAGADAVVHLAAIVGFPACQAVGEAVAWRSTPLGPRNGSVSSPPPPLKRGSVAPLIGIARPTPRRRMSQRRR